MSVTQKKLNMLYDSEGQQIRLGKELGRGGEGIVYDLPDYPDLVAKIYIKPIDNNKVLKLTAMTKSFNKEVGNIAAWPYRTLHKSPNSSPVGFLMRKIAGYKDIHELYGTGSRKQEFPKADWKFIIATARNLASAVNTVHNNNCVIGDLNDKNILVGSDARVSFIDCDSYQIAFNGQIFRCEVGVPEYTSPELQNGSFSRVDRTTNHDNFALSVFIFKLLFLARHPFSGRFLRKGEQPSISNAIEKYYYFYSKSASINYLEPPPGALSISGINPSISTLFERAFNREGSKGNNRPSAKDWILALDELNTNLKTCNTNSSHIYYKNVNSCPWCLIETGSSVVLFSVSGSTKVITGTNGNINLTQINGLWAKLANVSSPGASPYVNFGSASISVLPVPLPSHIANEINDQKSKNTFQAILLLVFEIVVVIGIVSSGLLMVALSLWFITIPLLWWGISSVKKLITNQPTSPSYKDELNNRNKELKEVKDKLEYAKKRWDELASEKRFTDKRNELKKAFDSLNGLDSEQKLEIKKLEDNRKVYQLQKYLEKELLDKAKLDGIGTGLKAQLASYGIDTAADIIRYKVEAVPGFGPARVSTLMNWRNSLEARFVFKPNQSVDPKDIQAIRNKYDQKLNVLANKLHSGEAELLSIKNDILAKRNFWMPQITALSEELTQKEANVKVFNTFPSSQYKLPQVKVKPIIIIGLILGFILLCNQISKIKPKQEEQAETTTQVANEVASPVESSLYYVTGNDVNLREQPYILSSIVSKLKVGQEVSILETKGDWNKVSFTENDIETTGWLNKSFIASQSEAINVIDQKLLKGRENIHSLEESLKGLETKLVNTLEKLSKLKASVPVNRVYDQPLPSQIYIPPDAQSPISQSVSNEEQSLEALGNEIKSVEQELEFLEKGYKDKRNKYYKLKESDNEFVDAYNQLTNSDSTQYIADNEIVDFKEGTSLCGSAGCSLTITDINGKVLFDSISQVRPFFLFNSKSTHHPFLLQLRGYSGDGPTTVLYTFDEITQKYIEDPQERESLLGFLSVFD